MERAELNAVLRATGCGEERGGLFFLFDPSLGSSARPQIAGRQSEITDGWLCVATGGSSGGLKFARHDEHTLTAAVEGFRAHFEFERVNAVDVLPAYHVSGLMARVRCAATGGQHVAWDWKQLEAGSRPPIAQGESWVISLVPTQLQRLLASEEATAWLRRFATIFIGGGPVWPALAEAAAKAELRVSLSYGMTETAAMVAALRPEEFLAGARSSGAPLPHARIDLGPDVVRVAGESVFRGYWPEASTTREFVTEDLGYFDARGHLHVSGRRDAVIITGGKKVQPAEVEAALRASGEFSDVAVIGVPDAEWGEAVVACYPATERTPNFEKSIAGLAGFQRPKRFVAIAEWPRNAQGKINHAELRRQAK
jgi:O-succinylbenzoic acid--CoA ligase